MAGPQYPQQPQQHPPGYDPYQQGYDPNQGYPPEEETDLSEYSDEENAVTKSLPWMAIALVIHAVGLLVAAFMVYHYEDPVKYDGLASSLEALEMPPPPEEQEPPPIDNVEEQVTTEDVTEEKIVEEAVDERNEDPTDSPLSELDSPDSAESPNPNIGPNSAFGFGGGAGGGGGQGGGGGLRYLRSGGGGRKPGHHSRTDAALQWLADHQNPNGHWSASNFHADSIRTQRGAAFTYNVDFRDEMARMLGSADHDKGQEQFNVGLTGLAMLAFLGDGNTHKEGKYARNVQRALRYILGTQDAEGCFGARDDEEFVYNHAICAMAMAELQEMAPDPRVRGSAQRSIDFIVRCQNPGMGWRYGVQPKEDDSSVTAWMVLALKSAKLASLEFDEKEVYGGALRWYERVTGKDENGYDRTGYLRPVYGNARFAHAMEYDMNPSMDACSVMVRLFTEAHRPSDPLLARQARLLLADMPTWYIGNDESKGPWKVDFYYWYYASLALFQMGDSYWKSWEANLINPTLLKFQRGWHDKDIAKFGDKVRAPAYVTEGGVEVENPAAGRWILDEHGSWDPVDPWGSAGGRVYSTAINALTLEVYYRYYR
jgi:hypothetical protein